MITFSILNLSFPLFGKGFQSFLRALVPEGLWINFTNIGYETLDISRLDIWRYASRFALEHPIVGNGARSFTSLLYDETGLWKGHSHNLILELATSYGLPSAIIFFTVLVNIIFQSGRIIFSLAYTKEALLMKIEIIIVNSKSFFFIINLMNH